MAKSPSNWRKPENLKYSQKQDHRICQYPSHLRGMATNRYGGNNLQRECGLRGGTYGPAGAVRIYTEKERAEYESELRHRGDLQ